MKVTNRLLALAAVAWGCGFAIAANAQVILIPTNTVWKYLDDGSNQGTAWRQPGFNDAGWSNGVAELGFGDAGEVPPRPEATLIRRTNELGETNITYYFRRTFNVSGAAAITNLKARVMRDDGAVVYLNGTDVGRTGMPQGMVDYQTLAASPGVSGADEYTFFELNLNPALLAEGPNVLAVEVHQLAITSSDLSFALELVVITNSPPTPPPSGNTLILPASVANVTAGFGAGTLRAANYRNQQVYGTANFPPDVALWITELRYRPDVVHGSAFNTTINNIQIYLSTTTRSPDGLSSTYASNIGPDETEVFNGAVQISSQFTGPPGGPKDFDIAIPLTEAFYYDPEEGNLLVDIRNVSGSGASLLSGQEVSSDSASRVGGNLGSAVGGAGTGVDALQIVFTLTNPPPRPPRPILLSRGPYLQRGTTTNVLVCWRTSKLTNAIARFGLAPGALTWAAHGVSLTNNHCVLLTNLAPGTKYFYSIGATDTNFAAGPDYYFITAPTNTKPTRIWALGDCGTASQPGQTGALLVRDAYHAFAGSRETDVWLMLGDNAYGYGKDSEYQAAVFEVYQSALRRWPLWSTVGNHETYSPIAPQPEPVAYWDIFHLPMQGEAGGVASGTERYYSFDYANIHFVCLDSEYAYTNNAGADMVQWLEADLASTTNDWIIAFWHSPPYTKGSHNSDQFSDSAGRMVWMREIINPIIESYGVDLVLNGHSHSYERSYLLRGHYGYSQQFTPSMKLDAGSGRPSETGPYRKPMTGPQANLGTVYIVAGSSGWATFLQGIDHPAMFSTLLNLGSMVIDVDNRRLDARFLRENGTVDDSFTIIKGDDSFIISSFQVEEGSVTVRFMSQTGHHYQIERSPQVEPASWSPASGIFPATGSLTIWSAPVPPGAERSFYRVVQTD